MSDTEEIIIKIEEDIDISIDHHLPVEKKYHETCISYNGCKTDSNNNINEVEMRRFPYIWSSENTLTARHRRDPILTGEPCMVSGLLVNDTWSYSMFCLQRNTIPVTVCKPDYSPVSVPTPENKPSCGEHECDQCGKVFERAFNLRTHMKLHTGERPYKCEECGKQFREDHHLKIHLRTHTGERPYTCSECGKSFTQSGNYKNHLRIHTGEKPFQCEYCKKPFARKTDLSRHLRIHTGEKPYRCYICAKTFAVKHNLKTHMRIHTDAKPFKCEECEKTFNRICNMKFHMRNHHGDGQNLLDEEKFSNEGDIDNSADEALVNE